MPECNCTINKEYIYNEFTLKTEKLTKLINNDFVVKLTYDLLDNDKNILLNKELIVSSLFESIGIDLYNVITSATHHHKNNNSRNTVINSKTIVTKEEIENNSPHDLVALKITPTVTTSDLVETKKFIRYVTTSSNNTIDGNHTFSLKLIKKNNTKNIQSKSGNSTNAATTTSQPPKNYFLVSNSVSQLTFDWRFFVNAGLGTVIGGEVVGNGGNLYLRDYKNEQKLLTIPSTAFIFNYSIEDGITWLVLPDSANNYKLKLNYNDNYYITIDSTFMKFTNNFINNPTQGQNVIYYQKNQPITEPNDKYWSFNAAKMPNPPTLKQVTPIATPSKSPTPSYVFTTDQAGTLTTSIYQAFYKSGAQVYTINVKPGTQTITFYNLPVGNYSGETITLTNAAGNTASLTIPDFTITP